MKTVYTLAVPRWHGASQTTILYRLSETSTLLGFGYARPRGGVTKKRGIDLKTEYVRISTTSGRVSSDAREK
jgi:hypothetical protein